MFEYLFVVQNTLGDAYSILCVVPFHLKQKYDTCHPESLRP